MSADTRTYAAARLGHTVVYISWIESGQAGSDAPAERTLRAAVAGLKGEAVPHPSAAPAAHLDPAVVGYLTNQDVDWTWEGDHRSDGATLPCGDTKRGDPGDYSMPTAQAPITRLWHNITSDTEFGWSFSRTPAADAASASGAIKACRASLSSPKSMTGVGDEGFCGSHRDDGLALLCFARSGADIFLFSQRENPDVAQPESLLKIAISRAP